MRRPWDMEGTLCLGGTLGTSSCHPPWGHLGDVDHGPHATSLGSFWWHLGDTLRTSLWGHRVITPLVAPWGHFGDIIMGASLCHHPLGDTLVAPWGHREDTIVGASCHHPLGGTLGTIMDVVPPPLGTLWWHLEETMGRGGDVVPWWHLGDIIVPPPPWGHHGGTLGTITDVVPSPPWGHLGDTLWTSWGRCGMWRGRRALVAPWGHVEDIIVPPTPGIPLVAPWGQSWMSCQPPLVAPWGHRRAITPLVTPWRHFGDILGTLWDMEGTLCLGGTLGTLWGHHCGGIMSSPPWWHLGDNDGCRASPLGGTLGTSIMDLMPPLWGLFGGTLGTP